MAPLRTLGAAAALLALSACNNDGNALTVLKPELTVAPGTLDFGEVIIDDELVLDLSVVNSGRADLEVTGISFTGTGAEFLSVDVDAFSLEVDGVQPVRVAFAPTTPTELSAELVIESNALDAESFSVPVIGAGLDVPACALSISTDAIDFGAVAAEESSDIEFVVFENVGRGPCTIDDIQLLGSGAFTIVAPADFGGGMTISPEAAENLVVEYTPFSDAGDAALISFATNDPALATGEISLSGNGGTELVYPEAVIDCPSDTNPPTTVSLDGSASVDPVGGGLTYHWFLVEAPEGSNGLLFDADQPVSSLLVDVAGDWEVQLQVEDSTGIRSAPATCHFEAVPENLIHVELVWDSDEADMDLHLAQAGYSLFEAGGDVSWCNESPEWGESGAADNPTLEQDSEAYGPENIVIPEPANGNYDVRVHYYKDNGSNRTDATVRIWLNGSLRSEYTREMNHNDVWDVGYIRWPDAVFVPDDAELYKAETRECPE